MGSGPEIVYFRHFRPRSVVAWPTAISDSHSRGVALRYLSHTHTLHLSSPALYLRRSTSVAHGPPSPVLALQDARKLFVDRPRVPAPRVAHLAYPFQDVKIELLLPFSHPQDAVGARA
ncbi:hypothetical protein EDB85DRAFT_2149356 [Lactarius pseudohatsudake]|nr:hypothetical protein EDB85DRAFT_2149356 [Lactarius pseudohatsudake]